MADNTELEERLELIEQNVMRLTEQLEKLSNVCDNLQKSMNSKSNTVSSRLIGVKWENTND